MSPATSPLHPPLSPRQRRGMLAAYKGDEAVAMGAWLDDTSHEASEVVRQLLRSKARDARNLAARIKDAAQNALMKFLFFFAVYLMFFLTSNKAQTTSLYMALVQLLDPFLSVPLAGKRMAAANVAALLLARTDDPSAARYLADLWTPRPLTRAEAAFNADVSRELLRLLSEQGNRRFDAATEDALCGVLNRAFPGNRFARAWRRWTVRRDLSEADADLLLSIVRHLSHEPPKKSSRVHVRPQTDEIALRRVASGAATGPHYGLLRDTAQTLLIARPGGQSS